jgi:hypothetical protein
MAPQVCDSASRRGFSEIDHYSSGEYGRCSAPRVVPVRGRLPFMSSQKPLQFFQKQTNRKQQGICPRLTDIGGTRFWRIDPRTDYCKVNVISQRQLHVSVLRSHSFYRAAPSVPDATSVT